MKNFIVRIFAVIGVIFLVKSFAPQLETAFKVGGLIFVGLMAWMAFSPRKK